MQNEKRLIDANAVIEEMNAVHIRPWDDAEDTLEFCVNLLHNTPTVDAVEVVHGRWISSATTWGEKAICSVCGRDLYVNEPGNGLLNIEDLHYCPNCGAKMDGGNEE